jgi:type II secretory pathway pseudopilin PulG
MILPMVRRDLRQTRRQAADRPAEAGYSLLMVVFLVATSLILSSVVVPNLLTQGRREREAETVWRGQQYERAIGLYFRKFGRYPTKVDDLTRQTNGARFLRKAYTDPMNKDDGSWRFIYVGPNGQLIGSTHSQSLLQSVLGTSAATGTSLLGGAAQPPPPPPGAATGIGATGAPVPPQGQQTGQQPGGALAPNSLQPQPQGLTGAVIGGNIIGVGSKIKESSLMLYKGYDSYDDWEFIWNPMQQGAIPGQPAVNPNAPPVNQNTLAPGQVPGQNQQIPPGTQPQQPPQQMPPGVGPMGPG